MRISEIIGRPVSEEDILQAIMENPDNVPHPNNGFIKYVWVGFFHTIGIICVEETRFLKFFKRYKLYTVFVAVTPEKTLTYTFPIEKSFNKEKMVEMGNRINSISLDCSDDYNISIHFHDIECRFVK